MTDCPDCPDLGEHEFDPVSHFCRRCGMARLELANDPSLADCTPENARAARERRAKELADCEATSEIDAEPIPRGTTWGDLRRALGFARWPL